MESKKRGRKPKGGKLMDSSDLHLQLPMVQNIILHLKCNSKDISHVIYNNTCVECSVSYCASCLTDNKCLGCIEGYKLYGN